MRSPVRRLLAAFHRRLVLLASRAVVLQSTDSGALQRLQVRALAGEALDGVERLGEYGFASRPLPGATGLLVCLGGNRDHPVMVGTEDTRHRLRDLEPGEVALYTDEGDLIVLRRGRTIEIVAGGEVAIQAPEVTLSGNLTVAGSISTEGSIAAAGSISTDGSVSAAGDVADALGSMLEMRTTYNTHTHSGGGSGPPNQPMI